HRARRGARPGGRVAGRVQRGRAPRLRGLRPLGHRAHPRDRVHQPHREGPPRMTAVTIPNTPATLAPTRKPVAAARVAYRALLLRDLVVLRKTLKEFIP